MSAPSCTECQLGQHSRCTGDFTSTALVVTCHCRYCKAYLDAHGPFAEIPDEPEFGETHQP